ncbi:MAG: alginate export family protein, partial [Planctomycetes bacterium]|nr:alginate export family protein [Planctomycetota bacterium]
MRPWGNFHEGRRIIVALGLAVGVWAWLAGPALRGEEAKPPAGADAAVQQVSPPAPASQTPPAGVGAEVSKYLKLDGQLRFRYELFDPFAYTTAGVDQADDAVLMRTRLGALFTPHRKVSARIQLQDSRIWGEEGSSATLASNPSGSVTTSIDNVDIHQAYVDLNHIFESYAGEDVVSLRVGRQELSYGDQRIVSPLDWTNIGRAWDGGKLSVAPPDAPGKLKVDVFGTVIRDTVSSETGGGPTATAVSDLDAKQGFHGIYAAFQDVHIYDRWAWTDSSGKALPVLGPHQLDLFAFYRDLSDGSFTAEDGNRGNVDEVTLGARVAGKVLQDSRGQGFDYSGEAAWQGGRFAGDDIRAYGYVVTGGYTAALSSLDATKVRLGAEYDYGSGDSDPTDGDHETFDPLFPFGHLYQGIQDTFSWK